MLVQSHVGNGTWPFLYLNLSHALRGVLFHSPCCWGTQAVMNCEIMVLGIQRNFLCDIVRHVDVSTPCGAHLLILHADWSCTLSLLSCC